MEKSQREHINKAMTTLGDILGATMSADCCEWTRGVYGRSAENYIFIPRSSGEARTDRTYCCHRMLKDNFADSCCDAPRLSPTTPHSWIASEGQGAGKIDINRTPPDDQAEQSQVKDDASPPDDQAGQSQVKDDASPRTHSQTHSDALPEYVRIVNNARAGSRAVAWDKTLEELAAQTVATTFRNGCVVPTNEKPGMNTFAIQECAEACEWFDIVNSWAAEKGASPCQVAHRATLLNPRASSVGCAMETHENCIAGACAFDEGAIEGEALSISRSRPTPKCASTCCGALPCRNTLC